MLDNQRIAIDQLRLKKMTMSECEKLGQEQFANKINSTHATVNRWCNMQVKSITFKMVKELANYFDVSAEEMQLMLGGTHTTEVRYSNPDTDNNVLHRLSMLENEIKYLRNKVGA